MRRLLILPTIATVILTMAAPAALAADNAIVHRQSVLTEVDASGALGTSRVFTQMTVPKGDKISVGGQSTSSLRSLTGATSRDGDNVVFGGGLTRTVADHTADLPVDLEVTYSIDGETVAPRDVVGHDGEVAVTYVVRNLTSESVEVTVADGDRVATKETVDVAVPLVGSLSMTLPSQFSDIDAPGAVVVGDGRGNTVVNWSLLLFAPLGSEVQEVTWTANARDAIVPDALLQIVPVSPASFGSFDATANAYDGAVNSTRELTTGTREIDRNLKLLADGAGKLLAGLTQLRDGSAELATGLGAARDGSAELSAGLGQARDGGQQLSSGLGDLSNGASRIADGLAALDAGAVRLGTGLSQLADGSSELATGVGQLSHGAALVDSSAKELAAGSGQLATGAGDLQAGLEQLTTQLLGSDDPATMGGIDRLQAGIEAPGKLLDGLKRLDDELVGAQGQIDTQLRPLAGGVINGAIEDLEQLAVDFTTEIAQLKQIRDDTSDGATKTALTTEIADLETLVADGIGAEGPLPGTGAGIIGDLQLGLARVDGGLALLSAGIGDAETAETLRNGVFLITRGVSNPGCDPASTDPAKQCGLLEGLQLLEEGVAAGLGNPTVPGETLRYGAAQVAGGSALVADGAGRLQAEGTAPIAAGAAKAADGAEQLAAGATQADAGAEQLTDGSGQLADGSVELADGAGRAASGSSDLVDGLRQLDEGGKRLSSGLVDAADGSQQIADGLARATPGGEQIANGAQRLTDEGTSVLARSVSDASASSSLQLAHVRAVAARGTNGDGLPYPTVGGADASAVYEFELAGVGADTGPGAAGQIGIGALALLAAALLGTLAGGRLGRRDEVAEV